jgi:hypothetical protein
MGTLIFVCPTTGHEVSTGVEVDRSRFKSYQGRRPRSFVRAVARDHKLSVIWAWLANEVREAPDENPSAKSAA